jgi:8-oxo-dGTP diphosphatase
VGDELVRIKHTYRNGGTIELRFFVVREYGGEIDNRIFKDVRWVAPSELPGYDFLEADVSLVNDLAAGKLL